MLICNACLLFVNGFFFYKCFNIIILFFYFKNNRLYTHNVLMLVVIKRGFQQFVSFYGNYSIFLLLYHAFFMCVSYVTWRRRWHSLNVSKISKYNKILMNGKNKKHCAFQKINMYVNYATDFFQARSHAYNTLNTWRFELTMLII